MGKTDKNNLGQYFTPSNIAQYMSNELLKNISGNEILDPCIGKNIFFECLCNEDLNLTGVEIDGSIITKKTKDFYKKKNRKLIISDFINRDFDFSFDGIIMNPPYIRQEKITPPMKTELRKICKKAKISLSSKANLYIYFILKSLLLLKDGGMLAAITYDSWLYSSFGESFKKYLCNNFHIERIIHFKNKAFDGVDVGATILFIKKKRSKNLFINYSLFNSIEEFSLKKIDANAHALSCQDLHDFNEFTINDLQLNFSNTFFQPLGEVSAQNLWRGSISPSNRFFLFKNYQKGLTPVLKKISKNYFSVSENEYAYAFSIKDEKNKELISQLIKIKEKILKSDASESLKKKVVENPRWYFFSLKNGGEIIFNYYFRDNPQFILNPKKIPTMSNFYNISCSKNMYELFALMNSSLTKYSLLKYSKSQGRGLRKIQLYKFKSVPILKLSTFENKDLNTLKRLGRELSIYNRKKTLDKIDNLVINHYSELVSMNPKKVKEHIMSESIK